MDADSRANSIRVLLAGDYAEKIQEIRSYLQKDQGVMVLGEVSDCNEAVQMIQQTHPHLVILALSDPEDPGSGWKEFQRYIPKSIRTVLYTPDNIVM